MASGTAADGGSLKLDSIPIVDLRLLSQSELYSLSLSSTAALDPRRCDDVVVPKIDRSVFNESAGSRKQTYSRLRLAPPSSSASSSSSNTRRRTPHLRSAGISLANVPTNNSDPENDHIVSLLKQLFSADVNPEELVPVKIDFSDSLRAQQFSSQPRSSQSSWQPMGNKRKRGGPRRDEIAGNEGGLPSVVSAGDASGKILGKDGGLAPVVSAGDASGEILGNEEGLAQLVSAGDASGDAGQFQLLNEVHDKRENKDRDILNKDGVAVDLVALGVAEHPYREEIGRRTEGLTTEEDLLGFLEGLTGEWGSRRKKMRVVDANEFGTALPNGWKVSLSVQKENGQVWMYCRRYISPGGLHFVTCKGVSSYLLSLHGIIDTSLPNSTQPYEIVNDVDSLTPSTVMSQIPDLAVKDAHREENLLSHTSSPAIDSTSGNHEIRVMKTTRDFPKGGVGEILHCNKCNITFERKDELLQHQSSHQRNRSKHGTRITDGVIIKDGKYECQFCHKTFDERHRYNGHVGAHVRYQAKIAGERSGNVGESVDPCSGGQSVDPSSFGEFEFQKNEMHGLLNCDQGGNMCSLSDKGIENVGDLKGANGDMRRNVGVAVDIVNKTEQGEVSDVILSGNGNKSFHEDVNAKDCAAESIDDDSIFQGGRSLLPVDAAASHGLKNVDVVENSSGTQNPEKCSVSKTSLQDSNQHLEECKIAANNCISEARNEIKLDSEKLPVNGSVLNFFGTHGDIRLTSESMVSKLDVVPNVNMPRDQDENACDEDNVPDLIGKCDVDETKAFGISEKGTYQAADDAVSRHGKMQVDISSAIPSWNEQEKVPNKYDAAATCLLTEPVVQNSWKSTLAALFGHENMSDLEDNDDEVCGGKNTLSEFDHYQPSGNGESTDPFSSNHADLNSNSIMGTLQDMELGACTGLPSATDKQFFQENNMMRIFDGASEEHSQGQPRGVPLKPNTILNTGKHELSLSFGNHDTELCTDSSRAEQRMYPADRVNIQSPDGFNMQSVFNKTFGNQTNLSARNRNIPDDLNQGRPFNIDMPDSSTFSIRTHNFGSNFNPSHSGNQMGNSGQNFMSSFGNSSSQPVGCGAADDSWRTGHGNVFQGTFDANARLQIPSTNYFETFGLTSDKGEESQYGVSKNYNMLRPAGRTEPVEYRFLGEQSSNTVAQPEEPKMFTYTANMQQGLDPPFWLGKDALMPYTAHNTTAEVSSICVWCRNMFYHQPDAFGAQTGTIGSMCPSCSSRIPGQFNVL